MTKVAWRGRDFRSLGGQGPFIQGSLWGGCAGAPAQAVPGSRMDEQRRRGSRRSAVGSTTSVLSIRGAPRGKGRGIRGPHAFATDPGSPQDTRQEADQEADEEVRLHPAPLAGCQMNRMAARVGRIRAVLGDSGSGGSELGFDGITGDPAETVLEFVGGGQHDCGPSDGRWSSSRNGVLAVGRTRPLRVSRTEGKPRRGGNSQSVHGIWCSTWNMITVPRET